MQTNHLLVLNHIRIKDKVGTAKLFLSPINFLTDRSKAVLLL